MPNLGAIDWMIALIYFFFVISVALGLRQFIAKSNDFLLAGRALPAWLCGFALVAASLGSLELLGAGAAGARYGAASTAFFGLGSIVPLLFAGLFLAPVYYRSRARSLSGYLGLRFDAKTRSLHAILFLATSIIYAALSLYAMARVLGALGVFNVLFHAQSVGSQGVLMLIVALFAAIALAVVLVGGLGATMYAQAMQFFVLAFAFLPVVLLGLKQAGGWSGMKAAFATAAGRSLGGAPAASGTAFALAAGLGILLTAGCWCADFSLLQTAMAAQSPAAARRAPLLAAAAKVFLPFLLVVPGIVSLGLPTPHTTELVRNENGTIYHEISVVPRIAEEGQGLVPARTGAAAIRQPGSPGSNIPRDAHGRPLLDYAMATPNLLPFNLPTGLLGLAITALLACLTGGLTARVMACGTVFACDLWPRAARKTVQRQTAQELIVQEQKIPEQAGRSTQKTLLAAEADKKLAGAEPELSHPLALARWAALAATAISAGLACVLLRAPNMPGLLDLLALSFAVLYAPMLVTFLLGVFWRRTSAHGAFAGLITGFAAALAHYGLTLPPGEARGIAGGWIAVLHHPANFLAQNAGTALCGWIASLIVTVAVSLFTAARPRAELASLVFSRSSPANDRLRPAATFAGVVLVAAIAVCVIFFY